MWVEGGCNSFPDRGTLYSTAFWQLRACTDSCKFRIAIIIQDESVYQRKLSAMYRMSVDTYESRESKYLPWARICKNFKSCMQERKALGANDHETDGKRSVGRMWMQQLHLQPPYRCISQLNSTAVKAYNQPTVYIDRSKSMKASSYFCCTSMLDFFSSSRCQMTAAHLWKLRQDRLLLGQLICRVDCQTVERGVGGWQLNSPRVPRSNYNLRVFAVFNWIHQRKKEIE